MRSDRVKDSPPETTPARLAAPTTRTRALAIVVAAGAVAGYGLWSAFSTTPAAPHIQAGLARESSNDIAGATREYELAAAADPRSAKAWMLLGRQRLNAGDVTEAAESLGRAARLDSSLVGVHSLLAACRLRMGDLSAAEREALSELARRPGDTASLEVLSAVATRRGDGRTRLKYLRDLAAANPEDPRYLRPLAAALYSNKMMAELLPVANRLASLDPLDADSLALRGEAAVVADPSPAGLARAERDLTRAVALNPTRYASLLALGRLLADRGETDRAGRLIEDAARLQPDRSAAWYELASLWQRAGRVGPADAARRKYRAASAKEDGYVAAQKRADASPSDFDRNLRAGQLAIARKDLESARHYMERAFAVRPSDPGVNKARAQLQAAMQELSRGDLSMGR